MSVQWSIIGKILEVVAKDSKDRWMKWGQGALSGKVLTQIPNPVRNPEEDYYENDPLYYNGARRQGTYQWIKLVTIVLGMLRIMGGYEIC
jgi:hypothetical protein